MNINLETIDWAAVQAIINLLAFSVIIYQLMISIHWNKMNATFTFFKMDNIFNRRKDLFCRLKNLDIDPFLELDDTDVDKINNDHLTELAMRDYLNEIEMICTGYNYESKAVDKNLIGELIKHMVEDACRNCHRFIIRKRESYESNILYKPILDVGFEFDSKLKDYFPNQ